MIRTATTVGHQARQTRMLPRPPRHAPLHVGVGKLEREPDAGQRRCSTETGSQCKTVLAEPVAGPRTRKCTVSTAPCRAGIELRRGAGRALHRRIA